MFKDVQKLRLAEAEAKLQALYAEKDAMYEEVHALKRQMEEFESKFLNYEWQEKNGMKAFRGKNISTFKRLISPKARAEYKKYQTALSEMRSLQNKLAVLPTQIELAEMQASHAVADSGIGQKIAFAESTDGEINQIQRSMTLAELGMAPDVAMEYLEAHDVNPVLDESDNVIFERPREYETKGKAALCAVHKMDIMPENSRLSTIQEAGVERTEKIELDGNEYEYRYLLERNTVHLSMNDEVSSHMFGNWENCHYCILQPCDEIPNEKIGAMEPNDTYTRGGIDLTSNAWILCPANEVDTVKELNPHVHVLGYTNENAKGLAAPFLSQLGYRAEKVGSWGWDDHESEQQFYRLAERENLPILQHSNSTDLEDEEFKIGVNKMIGVLKMLTENNLIQSTADIERLRPQLNVVSCDFDNLLNGLIKQSELFNQPHLINQNAIIANHRQVDVLVEKLAKAGMPLSNEEVMRLRNVAQADGAEFRQKNGISIYEFAEQMVINSAIRARTMQTDRTM